MNEVSGNLNMMLNDGHEETAKVNATKKSKRFTVLGLTTLHGDPLMYVVIIEGKEQNPFLERGVDLLHPLYFCYNQYHTNA